MQITTQTKGNDVSEYEGKYEPNYPRDLKPHASRVPADALRITNNTKAINQPLLDEAARVTALEESWAEMREALVLALRWFSEPEPDIPGEPQHTDVIRAINAAFANADAIERKSP